MQVNGRLHPRGSGDKKSLCPDRPAQSLATKFRSPCLYVPYFLRPKLLNGFRLNLAPVGTTIKVIRRNLIFAPL
jgi:hypothetical protein